MTIEHAWGFIWGWTACGLVFVIRALWNWARQRLDFQTTSQFLEDEGYDLGPRA